MQETASLHSGVGLRLFSRLDPIQEFKLEAGTQKSSYAVSSRSITGICMCAVSEACVHSSCTKDPVVILHVLHTADCHCHPVLFDLPSRGKSCLTYAERLLLDGLTACAGATFVQALTDFRQECVWQALSGPRLHELNIKAQLADAIAKAKAANIRVSAAKPPSSQLKDGTASQTDVSAENGSSSSRNQPASQENGGKNLLLSRPAHSS